MYSTERQKKIEQLKRQLAACEKNKKVIEQKIEYYREKITVLMMEQLLAGTGEFTEEQEQAKRNVR